MNAKAEVKTQKSAEKDETLQSPRRWWQWFLVYPGLAMAVVGAVPTYIEAVNSYNLGVPFGRSLDAQEQNLLWQNNFECAQNAHFTTIVNKKNVEIGSTVCESGDVLLRGKRPEWDRPQLRWVAWNDVAPKDMGEKSAQSRFNLVSQAYAGKAENIVLAQAPPPTSILCQRWVGQGQLLQRIETPKGCFDQVVNTYNGWVLSNRPAPCNPQC